MWVDSILYSGVCCRFSESFDGVVLAYDFNILDKKAKILNGVHPYFGVRLDAKLLLFSPKPNMLLGKLFVVLQWTSELLWLMMRGLVHILEEFPRLKFTSLLRFLSTCVALFCWRIVLRKLCWSLTNIFYFRGESSETFRKINSCHCSWLFLCFHFGGGHSWRT